MSASLNAQTLLRVTYGLILLAHGFLLKVQTFTVAGFVGYMESNGFPAVVAYLVLFGEILGGLALVAGVLTRLVAWLSLPIVLGATAVHLGNGWLFSAENGGWEFPAVLVVMAVVIGLQGGGRFALEQTESYRNLLGRFAPVPLAA